MHMSSRLQAADARWALWRLADSVSDVHNGVASWHNLHGCGLADRSLHVWFSGAGDIMNISNMASGLT